MCRRLIYLISFVLALGLVSTGYGDVVGDFEGSLDGWGPSDATLSLSPTGATSGTGAMQVDGPGGWHLNALLDIKPYRELLGVSGALITADVTAFDADMTTTWMQVEMVINAQNNDDNGANNNIDWQGLGLQDVTRDGQPHTYTWVLPEALTSAIAGADENIAWFELALVSNLDGASVTKFYIDNIQLVSEQVQPAADTLSGLADVTVVDGAVVIIQHEGTEYVVANEDLVLGTTTRWYIDAGVEMLWAEGDPAPTATVSGTSNPKDGDVGSKADNFLFTLDGSTNISSIDGIDFQETIFPFLTDTFFLFERGGNDAGTWQAIHADGSLGAAVAFDKASAGGPYADTGINVNGQNAYGVVFKTSVPVQGVRITASGHDTLSISTPALVEPPVTITVEDGGDIAAANEIAKPGDTIEIAEGTYYLTSQIEIKDRVTYKGAGPGLTIIDGNDTTRAFVAWGDRGATNGQVDANGVGVPNTTGPKDWVLDGLTIQNCVADTANRQDILSAARDLLNNYTGTPYTLATAQAENGGITDNPGWFDILSGSADDDLTDVELQAYLDGNPVGSAGHLVVNDGKSGDGGAIFIGNEAVGTIANCDFLNNHTPAEGSGDDGGAINITGRSTITINDCLFNGNYAVSPDSIAVDGFSGHGGHIVLQGGSASAITPGTTLIANRCVFLNGNAEDDGGAIRTGAVGSIVRLDACWFEGNTSWDNGNVLTIGNESSGELTVTNCIFVNNITKADNSPDRMCEVRRNSRFINCTFVGNNQEDQDMIYNNADAADTDADGTDDEMADTTQVVNCIFANNVVGNGDDVLGSRNADFTIAATNCIFFGNTLQNGSAADNTQRPDVETGSVLTDPLLDANYVPGAGSEAIDGGVDPETVGVTLTTDYNGEARPQGAAYDIGAYEIAAAPIEPGILNVPKTSVAPIIDGQWDAVWNDVDETRCLITDMINTDSATPEDLNDLSAIFKAAYDDNNFYILVEVLDSVIDYEFSTWNGDGVEIYFDGDNSKGDSYDGINDNQIRITVDDVELADIDSSLPVDGTAFKVLLTDLGYNVEASFPLAKLQVSPDTIIGFEVQINDNDSAGGRETLLRWYSDDNDSWQNPSLFGVAQLVSRVVGQ